MRPRPRSPESVARRSAALLDLLEPGWRRDLSAGARAADLDVEADLLQAAARALGDQAREGSPVETARKWPACVVVALARVAGASAAAMAAVTRASGPAGTGLPGGSDPAFGGRVGPGVPRGAYPARHRTGGREAGRRAAHGNSPQFGCAADRQQDAGGAELAAGTPRLAAPGLRSGVNGRPSSGCGWKADSTTSVPVVLLFQAQAVPFCAKSHWGHRSFRRSAPDLTDFAEFEPMQVGMRRQPVRPFAVRGTQTDGSAMQVSGGSDKVAPVALMTDDPGKSSPSACIIVPVLRRDLRRSVISMHGGLLPVALKVAPRFGPARGAPTRSRTVPYASVRLC